MARPKKDPDTRKEDAASVGAEDMPAAKKTARKAAKRPARAASGANKGAPQAGRSTRSTSRSKASAKKKATTSSTEAKQTGSARTKRQPPQKKARTAKHSASDDGDASREDTRSATRARVQQVAYALQHRDEIVANVLRLLQQTGLIDMHTEGRLWQIYETGDTRTRVAIQDLVSRVLRVPLDRIDEVLDEDGFDPSRVNVESLERLASLRIPKLDVDTVSESVRGIDVERLVQGSDKLGSVFQLIADVPVTLHKLRRALVFGGVAVLLIVAAALAFPAIGLQVLYYGFLVILALVGAYLLKLAYSLDRTARRYELDLGTFVRLKPQERRIIMMRRLLLRFIDMKQVGDLVDRSLRTVVPEQFQAAEAAAPPPPSPRSPRRPLDTDPPGVDAVPTSPDAPVKRRWFTRSGKAARERPTD